MVFFLEFVRNLKTPEGFDLPLRGSVPNGIGSPNDMIFSKGRQDLSKQVGANDRFGDDELAERRTQFHVDIVEFGCLSFNRRIRWSTESRPFSLLQD